MIDLTIALGLIGIAVAMFLLSRMKILPKKSLPYVAAALAAAFGISMFKQYKMGKLNEEIRKQEEELKERERKLAELKAQYGVSDQKLQEMKAELDKYRAAYQKQALEINAKGEEEKKRIDALSGQDLYAEYLKTFGG